MKLSVAALVLLAGCATPGTPPRVAGPPVPVNFAIGPAYFHGGDSIRIDEVEASSPGFKGGDRVIVRGWYDLHSEDAATLAMFQTASYGVRVSQMQRPQTMKIAKGVGAFQFETVIPGPGALHVSFYPARGGSSFGGVYFGSAAQMEWAGQMKIGDAVRTDWSGFQARRPEAIKAGWRNFSSPRISRIFTDQSR